MAKNDNLHKAKDAKNDEFYTTIEDVAEELRHYKKHFAGKVVLCNCDDPTWSAFWRYFHLNFSELGLKKLIATHYDRTEPTYKMEYEGGDDNDVEVGVKTPLEGNGDFRSRECLDLLDECDIVVTNPPFSLFREFVGTLMERKKKFLIIGNMNAITYKEIFPLIRDNQMWVGANGKGGTRKGNSMCFAVPNDYSGKTVDVDGIPMAQVSAWWYTNMDFAKRHEKYIFWKEFNPIDYPKYDNYNAVDCGRSNEFPINYDGVVGVPISFLNGFYNPDQFEIVAFRKGNDGKDLVFTREREREFNRTFVSLYDIDSLDDKKRRRQNQWKTYLRENNNQTEIEAVDYFYPLSIKSRAAGTMNGLINGKETYRRILICKKAGT